MFYYKTKEMLEKMAIYNNSCAKIQVGFSAGKHYNIYMPSSGDKQISSINNLKLISRCQQNKIIIKLDNKGINDLGCNTKGMYTVIHW